MTANWRKLPRTGHSRFENRNTQPLKPDGNFGNPEVLVEGWYPLVAANELRAGQARSFTILKQRIAVWRTGDGELRAVDAFCPHMGADLGNGEVVGRNLRCYFHHWQIAKEHGSAKASCAKGEVSKAKIRSYPIEDYLGFIWIYAGDEVRTPLIAAFGLERERSRALKIAEPTLFAHHHVMMAGGIDLLHFATVHGIDIDFDFQHQSYPDGIQEWKMSGPIAGTTWRGRIGRFLVGPEFGYSVRVGGGSMIAIAYGQDQRFMGRYFKLPALHVLWGCVPLTSGVSKVFAFSVVREESGFFASLRAKGLHLLTLLLLIWLRDDDVKAFPNMRFQVSTPLPEDKPVLQLIFAINRMRESIWTKKVEDQYDRSVLNIGL